VHGSQDDRVFAIVEADPRTVRCLRVTGEICFVFEIVAADTSELEGITLQVAKLSDLATDLVYEVVSDRAVPV
jgi:Lrp/AsnC family leucine-responsive transcriptional regulator